MDYKDFNAEEFAKDAFFIKWVKGDPESQWFWTTFLSEHPSKADDIAKAREMVGLFMSFNGGDEIGDDTRESVRKHLLMSMNARRERDKEYADDAIEAAGFRRWVAVAASIAILILVVSVWYLNESHETKQHIARSVDGSGSDFNLKDSTEQRISRRGQKSVVLLVDGTKVWLNADSKLTYAKDFGQRNFREVYLEGEAFFDVVSDPEKPFIVHTCDLNIQVLGTSFNVKSYAEDAHVETTLVEGKVEIDKKTGRGGKQKVILKPNQKATFSKESQRIDVKEVVAEELLTWRRDRLVFKSEPLSEVIKQLERWYNVNIHVTNQEDLSCPLTANIETESLREVLDLLAVTHNISFAIEGKEVVIKGSLCR